jgi:hypothetical protein
MATFYLRLCAKSASNTNYYEAITKRQFRDKEIHYRDLFDLILGTYGELDPLNQQHEDGIQYNALTLWDVRA